MSKYILRYYGDVRAVKLEQKKLLGVAYKSSLKEEKDLELKEIALGEEGSLLKVMLQQPEGSRPRELIQKLLGESSYGFQLEDLTTGHILALPAKHL